MNALNGKSVLLTRTIDDNAAWAERLIQAGARCIALPCITTEPIGDRETLRKLKDALQRANWIIFTSRHGVEAFASAVDREAVQLARLAVVGPATAAAATQAFGRVDHVSDAGTARDLAQTLAARIAPGTEVLIAVAENAGDVLQKTLTEAGAQCTRIDLYRTVPARPSARKRALSTLNVDNVLLASPTAVAGLLNQVDVDTSTTAFFTIGPSTTAAAEAAGLGIKAQAETPSLEGLMEAMTCAS